MKAMMRFILVVLCVFVNTSHALDQTETGFFYPMGKASFSTGDGWWLSKDPDYFSGEYHLGVDMMANYGSSVFAIADGVVRPHSLPSGGWGDGNCALVVEHKTGDGAVFTAIYGHLQCGSLPAVKSEVYAGKPIGKIGHWGYGDHLHFGIHPGSYVTIAPSNWGRQFVEGHWITPCEGSCLNSMTDPIAFIQNNFAYSQSTEKQLACQGDVCWGPKTGDCDSATAWYRGNITPIAQEGAPWFIPTGKESCDDVKAVVTAIATAENPNEAVPEEPLWRRFWRHIRSLLGEIASAQEIVQTVQTTWTINTVNIYTGNVVAGNAAKAIHGAGQGYAVQAVSTPAPVPPDFITKRTWLVTPWGVETYRFGLMESFDTKAQSENIGDGSCLSGEPTTITGHFYLSKGYKEDPHSGDGAWRRIDSTTTQCDNLKPSDTHTETKNTVIREWITEPGIYNIVYCIDHPQDDHNNGGEHQEKHESNNCSTEAVFEVVAEDSVNQDPRFVDFTTSGLHFLQTPYYAGDQARFGAWVTNRGNIGSPTDIRSNYVVQCPGTGPIQLADDGTMASTLSAGASAFEENIGPVTLPNVAGTCTATFCADYLHAVTEGDEENNCTTLTFTLMPRPAPKLVITKFRDEAGCCTSNTGSRLKPDIWVRNDGPVAPATDVIVLYHISSPVATGGAWWNIGYGVIRPSELPPGGTDEDYMEGNGWPIPSNSAWKYQWHTIRACLRADGGQPIGDPATEVCAYYTRYSKK